MFVQVRSSFSSTVSFSFSLSFAQQPRPHNAHTHFCKWQKHKQVCIQTGKNLLYNCNCTCSSIYDLIKEGTIRNTQRKTPTLAHTHTHEYTHAYYVITFTAYTEQHENI